jgi:thiol-disulfide isomerase/thioredoxin
MNEPTAAAIRWGPLLGLWLLVPAGCATREPRPAPAADKLELSAADRAAYDAILATHRGHVVLVDFWALWCGPCVANFPHVIELADRQQDRGLNIVTVSMDAPSAAEKTLEFLQSQRAGIATNLISRNGGGSKAMAEFEIPSGIPCYKLYDRQGRLRHTFTTDPAAQRQFTLQDLEAAVEKLLAE